MEVRHPALTAEEVAGLLGSRPQTVEQVLRAELLEARGHSGGAAPHRRDDAPATATGRLGSAGPLRRLIAGALHVAADALYPPGTR